MSETALSAPEALWSFPTRVSIGAGRIATLGVACKEAGIERPLVVTDPGLVDLAPMKAVLSALAASGFEPAVFSGVQSNPTGSNVDEGCDVYRAGNHDGVVAVGGGSALDVGRLVAFAAYQDLPLWDFEDLGDNWTRADADAVAPMIAVPTTAGTGSEVGRAGVVTNEAEQRKVIVFHPSLMPVSVIADPELTVSLPQVLTVGTGMDALSHSLEALCARSYHPMARGIALEGCRLVLEHLPRVVANPNDIASRTEMMSAAAMGAVAFQRGLGGMHALAHPIGALFDTHHGMTNATLMPYVLEANMSAVRPDLDALARFCGITGEAEGVLAHIVSMRASLGVPHTLAELGVDQDRIDDVVSRAVIDPTAASNPKPFTKEFAAGIFKAAYAGELERI